MASACFHWRVPDCQLTSVERDPFYVDLARQNLTTNVVEADLANLPISVVEQSFDHVMFNPPFFTHAGQGEHDLKRVAHVEETPIAAWVDVARKRLKPKGTMTVIHRVERLAEFMQLMDGFGDVTILPVVAREGREAKRFILSARKGSMGGSRICPDFVMHDGAEHGEDGDDYSARARSVLRDGQPIVMKK